MEKNEDKSEEIIGGINEILSAIPKNAEKIITVFMILGLPSAQSTNGWRPDNLFTGKMSESSNTRRDASTIGAPTSRNGIPLAGEKSPIIDRVMTSIDIIREDSVREIEAILKFLDRMAGAISFLASVMNIRKKKIIALESEYGS